MNITKITPTEPACLGVVCSMHEHCRRYHSVEGEPLQTIGTCVDGDGGRPLFIDRRTHPRASCRKCGGEMRPGIAMAQTATGSADLGEVVTVSPGGPGRVVACNKCERCGWSVGQGAGNA